MRPSAARERAAAALSAAETRTRPAPRRGVRDAGQLLAPEQVLTSPQSRLAVPDRAAARRRAASARSTSRSGLDARRASPRRSASRRASGATPGCARPTSASCSTAIRARSRSTMRSRSCAPDGRLVYCLVLEYARHGDLRAYLRAERRRLARARRAPRDRGHPAGARPAAPRPGAAPRPHADERVRVRGAQPEARRLRPRAPAERQPRDARSTRSTRRWRRATSSTAAVPKWQARDDVYQMGQLIGMLVKGDARARIRPHEIRQLACTRPPEGDRLPLHRRAPQALRDRRRADRGAQDTRRRCRGPDASRALKGVHLAFTGILSRPRREAKAAARRAGAVLHGMPSVRTSVVVRGKPNPLQAAGREAGLKLMEIKRLRAKGHRITLLDERQFWRLAARRAEGSSSAGYLKHCTSSARPSPVLLPGVQVWPEGAQHQHSSMRLREAAGRDRRLAHGAGRLAAGAVHARGAAQHDPLARQVHVDRRLGRAGEGNRRHALLLGRGLAVDHDQPDRRA